MSKIPTIAFSDLSLPPGGTLVLLGGDKGKLGGFASSVDERTGGAVGRALKAARFTGKSGSSVDVWAPHGTGLARILVVGIGKAGELTPLDWLKLGGTVRGKLGLAGDAATVALEAAGAAEEALSPDLAAEFALGIKLRSYVFDKYRTRGRENGEEEDELGKEIARVTLAAANHTRARRAFARLDKIAGGVLLARDLVNEPANALGPVELAARARELNKLGVSVEVLDEKQMKKLKMAALLGVAQGSARPPQLVVMRWNGARDKKARPLAFVGKGVVFDTGGISIKPAGGMEDMKGDMGGAAAVIGLMHALAARKARANVVGVVGLVENMPDGKAQRPGDIVRSMSGQTIEIINTDAEGRLVLADALWYVQDRFKPKFMVDLATLTGAIIVALGKHYAGLFSNDDGLAARLSAAGEATGERVWRLPMGREYDKAINSKNADVKNSASRDGSAITAAHFLKRFVNDVPWAHLDVAGTAMAAPASDISKGWAPGFGVRLLDRLIADNYEK